MKRRDEEEQKERKKDKKVLKKQQENSVPAELLNNEEPSRKRSKLVLPSPQITDQEMEAIVKLGRHSEQARESVVGGVEGDSQRASDTLLADYAVTPGAALRTPRTPMAQQDHVLTEAQNIMALQNTDTPLKGGMNTPLVNEGGDFGGMTPQVERLSTPNTVLTTPYRTKEGQVGLTPGQTPGTVGAGTPVRDKLSINSEESLAGFEAGTPGAQYAAREGVATLKAGLSSLPAPRNDYEIVVPEDSEENVEMADDDNTYIEDQGDVDERSEEMARLAHELAMSKRSAPVKRDLPRPLDMNHAVLRPIHADPPLNDLQKAEEMIKREMILMMHHDCLETPTLAQQGAAGAKHKDRERGIVNESVHRGYLDRHPYKEVATEDMDAAKILLEAEMEVVKTGMQHGDLSLDAYTQVWEECLAQVLFLPGQQRYTRANLASKKDRIESLEKRLDMNRGHMTKEAKRAAKTEKKLKILTGGYQSRAAGLIKQLTDAGEQLEQTRLELETFNQLKISESTAIPRRLETLTVDVRSQQEREKSLQEAFRSMQHSLEEARLGNFPEEEEVEGETGGEA